MKTQVSVQINHPDEGLHLTVLRVDKGFIRFEGVLVPSHHDFDEIHVPTKSQVSTLGTMTPTVTLNEEGLRTRLSLSPSWCMFVETSIQGSHHPTKTQVLVLMSTVRTAILHPDGIIS